VAANNGQLDVCKHCATTAATALPVLEPAAISAATALAPEASQVSERAVDTWLEPSDFPERAATRKYKRGWWKLHWKRDSLRKWGCPVAVLAVAAAVLLQRYAVGCCAQRSESYKDTLLGFPALRSPTVAVGLPESAPEQLAALPRD